ncbi:MAG: CD1871A family CXXC motif-containing protein [Proteobacteria bacterium]|nr:CD1871A family CXXC motif-containing protein [Pseudomonadota bacterium]
MNEVRKSYLLLIFFVVIFILGINFSEFSAVLEKAIRICLSCVGIG